MSADRRATQAQLLDVALATIRRLNRRCQSAEAALNMRVEDWEQRSMGALRAHYFDRGRECERGRMFAPPTDLERAAEAVVAALRAPSPVAWQEMETAREVALQAFDDGVLTPTEIVDQLLAAVRHDHRAAWDAGLDTERVYAGEGGWEWFHQPSGRIAKTRDEAFAAYLSALSPSPEHKR